MCQANTQARIVTLLVAKTGRAESEIVASAHLRDDLGQDSFDLAIIRTELEDAFGIEIPPEREEKLLTVGDIFTLVEELHG